MRKQLIPKHNVTIPSKPFQKMFTRQLEFQKRFYNMQTLSTDREAQLKYLKLMILCIYSETSEALDWLSWKPWKKTGTFNRREFLNELIDIQHFLINAALGVGCDSDEFIALFFNKQHENLKRQEDGY